MVRPRPNNGRGKIVRDSIEMDAKTKESTRKTEEKLDGRNTEGHERKKPIGRPHGRQQWSLGVGQRRKSSETDIYICIYYYNSYQKDERTKPGKFQIK